MWNQNDYYTERERWDSQVANNSARNAVAWGTAHSNGWGETVVEDPIMFGVTFVHQPIVTYGFVLDDDDQVPDPITVLVPGGGDQANPVEVRRLPRCSGGVMRWVQDAAGYYIGAHVFVTVSTVDPILAIQAWLAAAEIVAGSNATITPHTPDPYGTDPGYDITHSFTFQELAIKEITE